MANSYLFDTKYLARRGDDATDRENEYRIMIGDKSGTVTADSTSEMELFDPGITIRWDSDQDRFSNAIMGSTVSFTARLDTDQLDTFEDLLDLDEGDVFCFLFDTHDGGPQRPYWFGHLLIEATTIRVQNEGHAVDMTFTDGLSSLRGVEWKDEDGDKYTGHKKLSFYVREIMSKLPAWDAFVDHNTFAYINVFRTIGLPLPVTETDGGDEFYYHWEDRMFDKMYVRAETFNKKKKQVDRIRNLESSPDFFSTADVLEDICKAFGATACMYEGYLNLANKADIAFLKGEGVHKARYLYKANTDQWSISINTDGLQLDEAQDKYDVLAGATKGRTMPISQAVLTHEEGGSDFLTARGYFANPNIHYIDYNDALTYQNIFNASGSSVVQSGDFFVDGVRDDIIFSFNNTNAADGDTIDLPFFQYPADLEDYIGFPAESLDNLEFSSGESLRLQFGGNAKFDGIYGVAGAQEHIGATLIVRVRIQLTTTDGDSYRLSRTVKTHAKTNGTPDFITIDVPGVSQDREYFRKLYNDIEWVEDGDSDYSDSWYEIMVPHADNENSGEGYGAPIITLTEEYGGQPSYAPIGTKLQGDNDGPGVILEAVEEGDSSLNQYFQEDISIPLPYGAGDAVLSFESYNFEMGVEYYSGSRGPRANDAAAEGVWDGETPIWSSAVDGGTGSELLVTNKPLARPVYIHFTGMRVAVGDGTENSDFVTKITGGDGYEIHNMGSSRIGSRKGFVNSHVNGTLWGRIKTSNSVNNWTVDPTTAFSIDDVQEKLRWAGHRAAVEAAMPDTKYDSLHSYVAETFLQIFGKSREKYNMRMVPKRTGSDTAFMSLRGPLEVMKTNAFQTNKGVYEYLLPMSYTWNMVNGVSGEWLKVGQARDLSTIEPVQGRANRGNVGGIVGLPPGVDVIGQVQDSKKVTNFDLDTLVDSGGETKPSSAIKDNPEDITLAAKSAISGYEGTYKFTVQDFFQAIVQSGIGTMTDDGYGVEADYVGTTSGILGDFNNDGGVGSDDLLEFLTQYGQAYTNDTQLFQPSTIKISGDPQTSIVDSDVGIVTLEWGSSNASQPSTGSNSITVLADSNEVEFSSGIGLPLSAFPGKRAGVRFTSNTAAQFKIRTYLADAHVRFYVIIKAYDSSDVLLSTENFTFGLVIIDEPGEFVDLKKFDFGGGIEEFNPVGNLSDTDIAKIRCSFGVEKANGAAEQFDVQITSVRFKLSQGSIE